MRSRVNAIQVLILDHALVTGAYSAKDGSWGDIPQKGKIKMLEFEHIETMEAMADRLKEQWEETNFYPDTRKEWELIQSYTQVCTAIAQAYMHYETTIDLDQPFIRIDECIIRKKDIIRFEILEENEICNYPKRLRMYTRDIRGNHEGYGPDSNSIDFEYDSLEAQMLLEWLEDKTYTVGTHIEE